MDTTEITLDEPQSSPRRSSSFRAGAAAGGDTVALLARKDSEIRRLIDEKTSLEEKILTAERTAAESKSDEVATARKIARAIETAERSFANERRTLQKLASRSDFLVVELEEANARNQIEVVGLIELHRIVDEAASRAQLLDELQAAVKPLRSKVTALNFQLRVSKAIELKNNQRKLAEVKSKLFDLETSSTANVELQKRCDALATQLEQANAQLKHANAQLEHANTQLASASQAKTEDATDELRQQVEQRERVREEEYQRQIDSLQEQERASLSENLKLQTELQTYADLTADLKARNEKLAQLNSQLNDEVATLDATVQELRSGAQQSRDGGTDAVRLLRGSLERLLAPLTRTRLDDDVDDDGLEFVKHVLTARLSEVVATLGGTDNAPELCDPESFVSQVFEVANVPAVLRRLHAAEVEIELKNTALAELTQGQTAATSAQIRMLETQLDKLGTAHERLEREAAERLRLVDSLMAQIDGMREEAADRTAVQDAEATEARAVAIQRDEDMKRAEAQISTLTRRLSDMENELSRVQVQRTSSEAAVARLTAEKQKQMTDADARFETETAKWRARVENLNAKLDTQLAHASNASRLNQELKSEIAKLQHECDEAREKLSRESATHADAIRELTQAASDAESRIKRLQSAATVSDGKLRESEQQVKTLESQLKSAQFELEQVKLSTAHATAAIQEELQRVNAELQTALSATMEKGGEAAVLLTACSELQRQLAEARDEIAAARSRLTEQAAGFENQFAQQRDRYQTELASLMANAQRLEMHCSERVKAVEAAADARVTSVTGDLDATKAKVLALEDTMMSLTEQLHEETQTSQSLRSRVVDLENAALATEQSHAIYVSEQAAKIAAARHDLAELQQALITAQHKAREAQLEAEHTRSNTSDQLLAVKRTHQKEMAVEEEKIASLQARVKALEASLKRKDAELQDQLAIITVAEQKEAEYQSAVAMRDRLKLDVDSLLRQCNSAQDKVDAALAEKMAAQAALAKSMAVAGELTNSLNAAQLQIEELERQRAAAKSSLEERNRQLEAAASEIQALHETVASVQDEALKISTLHAMTNAELASTISERQTLLQSLRDAEQLNVDLLERVAEVENSLDESRLTLQQEQSARMLESVTRSAMASPLPLTASEISASPSQQLTIMFDKSLRSRSATATVELAEFEIRTGLMEQANDYFVMVRRLRGLLDDFAHTDRLVRQRVVAEQRRVQSLSDHAASLQAECVAIREAWRVASSSSLTESILMLMLEEAQARRVMEATASHTVASVTRDTLVCPLQIEAQQVVSGRKEAAREKAAAESAVGRALQAEERLRESEASVTRLRQLLADADANARSLRETRESENAHLLAASQRGVSLRFSSVEADEAYCRWSIYESAFSGLALMHNMLNTLARAPRGRERRGLNVEHSTRLVREVAMWRSRCHAIVELEKASLDAAIDTAVRGRRDNLAPPRAAALVTIQTLEQMERRLLQQSFFDTQLMLAQCAGWC